MAYRDDLEAAQRRAEALEARLESAAVDAGSLPELVALRREMSLMRMELTGLKTELGRVERERRAIAASLADRASEAEALRDQLRHAVATSTSLQGDLLRAHGARAWATEELRRSLEAAREELAAEVEAHGRARRELSRLQLLRWIEAEPSAPEPLATPLGEEGLARFRRRFSPDTFTRLTAEARRERLRELAWHIARSLWLDRPDVPPDPEPAMKVLGAVGHVLSPRRGATLSFEWSDDGLRLATVGAARGAVVSLEARHGLRADG